MKIKNYFSFIFPFILFSIIFIFSSTAIILNIKKKNDFTSIPSPLIGKLSPEFEFYLLSDKKLLTAETKAAIELFISFAPLPIK